MFFVAFLLDQKDVVMTFLTHSFRLGAAAQCCCHVSVPDAPMCDCVENMPEVSKSDCNTYSETGERRFQPCEGNDLRNRYAYLNPDGQLANLVGKCDNA